jgi:hypothetical protein
LRDLNHPFDQRPEAGPPLPQAYPGRNRLSLNRNPLPRCADWPASDFDIRASGKFGGGNACCVAWRSQCRAAQRTAVTGQCGLASGVLRDKRPLHHFPQLASEKKKLWAVAPPPICGQQIGKMHV